MDTEKTAAEDQSQLLVYADELRSFLESKEQKVLLIHGSWGTGKTYFWKRFVKENRLAIKETFYSYISLFGSSSVAHIKGLVMFGGEALRPAESVDDFLVRGKNWIARKRRYFEPISLLHIANLGTAIAAFEELLIKDYLVCFDDLERRNKALDLEQVFGFVSVLKEQNNCRVVIICNEEELSRRDRRTLSKYREKIIDRQINYNPPFVENFGLIFPPTDTTVRGVFGTLGLNNIRVFQQTLWCIRYFDPYLKDCHAAVVEQFRQQCAKLAAVHYAFPKQLTFEEVRSTPWLLGFRDKVETEATDLIKRLEFMPTEADELIIDFLRNGYCDTAELKAVIDRLNQNHKRSEAEMELRRVWGLAQNNYRADSAALVAETKTFFEMHHRFLPFDYTKYLLDFVHKIEPSFDAIPLEQQAAEQAIPTADAGALKMIEDICKSSSVKAAVTARREELKPKKSIQLLVEGLTERSGWDPPDFAFLNEYSEQDLGDWLSQAEGPLVLRSVAELMARGQLRSADNTGGSAVGKKFRSILEKLAKRGALDAYRMESVFSRLRRRLKEFGLSESPEICPPATDARHEA